MDAWLGLKTLINRGQVEEGGASQAAEAAAAEAAAAEAAEVEATAYAEAEAAAAVVDHPEASQFNDARMTLYSALTYAGKTAIELSLGTWSGKPAEEGDPPIGVITGPHPSVSAFLVPPPTHLKVVRAPGAWKAGSSETTRASWAKGAGQAVMGQWTSRVAASCITLTPAMLLGDAGPGAGGGAGEFDVSLEHLMARLETIAATADSAVEEGEDERGVLVSGRGAGLETRDEEKWEEERADLILDSLALSPDRGNAAAGAGGEEKEDGVAPSTTVSMHVGGVGLRMNSGEACAVAMNFAGTPLPPYPPIKERSDGRGGNGSPWLILPCEGYGAIEKETYWCVGRGIFTHLSILMNF